MHCRACLVLFSLIPERVSLLGLGREIKTEIRIDRPARPRLRVPAAPQPQMIQRVTHNMAPARIVQSALSSKFWARLDCLSLGLIQLGSSKPYRESA